MWPIKSGSGGIRERSGFTLIELLLATALFLAAAATVTVFMTQGIRLFSKLSAASREEEAAVCMVKITRDLRNMVHYSPIPFEGAGDKVVLATLEDLAVEPGDADPFPVRVSYRYDAEQAKILREIVRPQTFERPLQTATETLLHDVRFLKFEYEGDPQEIPRKVIVSIEYAGRFGLRTMVQEVLIPSAPIPLEES